MKRVLILLVLGLGLSATVASAQTVPALINFQSQVLNPDGTPLATGDYELSFRVFDAAEGGTLIWGPQVLDGAGGAGHGPKIPVVQGYFNVMLGPIDTSSRPLTGAFQAANRFLEIKVGANNPISPRQQILSAPFALNAASAANATTATTATTVIAGAVNTAALADAAVNTVKLNDSAVTAAKLDPTIGVWTRSNTNVFRSEGNVGIGTSDPGSTLDVAGTVRITKGGHGAELLNLNSDRSWAFRQLNTGAGTALELACLQLNKNFIINTTGFVGIGTTNPQAFLHIAGPGSGHLRLQDTGLGNHWTIYTENHPTGTDGNLLFVSGTGSGPAGPFGFIQKATGNYVSGSDARLKQDVRSLGGVLDRVLQLRPVSYRFKSAPDSAQPSIGLIAQEVEPLFPEVVDQHEGMKALAYSELIPVAVGAIQELNQKLEQKLQAKEAELSDLKARLEKLEQQFKRLP